ncbi:MAG: hypothetical protein JST39_24240 [Bacteroidetes bacterium]|nr:hypothetical protein [Bacteroidota bacterium]
MAVKKGINGYALAFFIVAGLVIVALFMSVTARMARKKSDDILTKFNQVDAEIDSINRAHQSLRDSGLHTITISDSLVHQPSDSTGDK